MVLKQYSNSFRLHSMYLYILNSPQINFLNYEDKAIVKIWDAGMTIGTFSKY